MRLIDADALLKEIDREREFLIERGMYGAEHVLVTSFMRLVDDAPTVDAVQVQHGCWIQRDGYDGDEYYECSVCGEPWVLNDGTPQENNMNYCPRCGAMMDD